jgi:hypothetical protein
LVSCIELVLLQPHHLHVCTHTLTLVFVFATPHDPDGSVIHTHPSKTVFVCSYFTGISQPFKHDPRYPDGSVELRWGTISGGSTQQISAGVVDSSVAPQVVLPATVSPFGADGMTPEDLEAFPNNVCQLFVFYGTGSPSAAPTSAPSATPTAPTAPTAPAPPPTTAPTGLGHDQCRNHASGTDVRFTAIPSSMCGFVLNNCLGNDFSSVNDCRTVPCGRCVVMPFSPCMYCCLYTCLFLSQHVNFLTDCRGMRMHNRALQ